MCLQTSYWILHCLQYYGHSRYSSCALPYSYPNPSLPLLDISIESSNFTANRRGSDFIAQLCLSIQLLKAEGGCNTNSGIRGGVHKNKGDILVREGYNKNKELF